MKDLRQRGVSLVELLLGLAITVIVIGVGLPSLRHLLLQGVLRTESETLRMSLMMAREHAIVRGEQILVCPSSDANRCETTLDWHDGWIVFEDHNLDRHRQAAEPLLEVVHAGVHGVSIRSAASRRRLRFDPRGWAWGSNTTIRVCAPGNAVPGRQLILSGTGRLRVAAPGDDTCPGS